MSLLHMMAAMLANNSQDNKRGLLVKLNSNKKTVQKLQEGHGGWVSQMEKVLGKPGYLKVTVPTGDYRIHFGGITLTVNPKAVSEMSPSEITNLISKNMSSEIGIGDVVHVTENLTFLKAKLKDWTDEWENVLNKYGRVRLVFPDGDLRLKVYLPKGEANFTITKECVSKVIDAAIPKTIDLDPMALLAALLKGVESTSTKKCKGGIIKVDSDESRVEKLQEGHGGWVSQMTKVLGKPGYVKKILPSGDYRIHFGNLSFTMNPAVTTELTPGEITRLIASHVDSEICMGDVVRMCDSLDFIRSKHGGDVDKLKEILSKFARVSIAYPDGDLKLNIYMEDSCAVLTIHKDCVTKVFSALIPKKMDVESALLGAFAQAMLKQPSGTPNLASFFREGLSNLDLNDSESALQSGIVVRAITDIKKARELQENHGGWNDSMDYCLGKIGFVKAVQQNRILRVHFGDHTWSMNPQLVPEVPKAEVATLIKNCKSSGVNKGDIVQIKESKEQVKSLQEGHGGWNESMTPCLGQYGRVKLIDSDGDLLIQIKGGKVILHPQAVLKICDGLKVEGLKYGARVIINKSQQQVQKLQAGHGGWNPEMAKCLNQPGKIKAVLPTGDILVKFKSSKFVFNPECLHNPSVVTIPESKSPIKKSDTDKSETSSSDSMICPVCLDRNIGLVFGCGHVFCKQCGPLFKECPTCRTPVNQKIPLYI